jgi:hypothetical protein
MSGGELLKGPGCDTSCCTIAEEEMFSANAPGIIDGSVGLL